MFRTSGNPGKRRGAVRGLCSLHVDHDDGVDDRAINGCDTETWPSGGIGRRTGLKIPYRVTGVRVRSPPRPFVDHCVIGIRTPAGRAAVRMRPAQRDTAHLATDDVRLCCACARKGPSTGIRALLHHGDDRFANRPGGKMGSVFVIANFAGVARRFEPGGDVRQQYDFRKIPDRLRQELPTWAAASSPSAFNNERLPASPAARNSSMYSKSLILARDHSNSPKRPSAQPSWPTIATRSMTSSGCLAAVKYTRFFRPRQTRSPPHALFESSRGKNRDCPGQSRPACPARPLQVAPSAK